MNKNDPYKNPNSNLSDAEELGMADLKIEYTKPKNLASLGSRLGAKFADLIITLTMFKVIEALALFLALEKDIANALVVIPTCSYFFRGFTTEWTKCR